jgi:hypothetical protein
MQQQGKTHQKTNQYIEAAAGGLADCGKEKV